MNRKCSNQSQIRISQSRKLVSIHFWLFSIIEKTKYAYTYRERSSYGAQRQDIKQDKTISNKAYNIQKAFSKRKAHRHRWAVLVSWFKSFPPVCVNWNTNLFESVRIYNGKRDDHLRKPDRKCTAHLFH